MENCMLLAYLSLLKIVRPDCLSLTFHELGCLIYNLIRGKLFCNIQTAVVHVSQCAVLVRASEGGKMHAGRDQSSICVLALLNSSGKRCAGPESACCHGTHGLAVNSVVSITPVNLMAPYIISPCRLYLQPDLSPMRRTKTIHVSVRHADCKRRARQYKLERTRTAVSSSQLLNQ
jgi:hypothetical protein